MAVNAYLIIDGRPGPSTSKKDAIDILSFSFGASRQPSSVPGRLAEKLALAAPTWAM